MNRAGPAFPTSRRGVLVLLALTACDGDPAGAGDDLGVTVDLAAPDLAPPPLCGQLGLPVRAFDAKGPYGTLRDAVAADFTLTDQDGEWTLSKRWSGCESYVFVPDNIAVSPLDKTSVWSQDLEALLAKSNDAEARNVHYFFVSTRSDPSSSLALLTAQFDGALAQFPDDGTPGSQGWWREHVHFVQTPLSKLGGWVAGVLQGQQVGIRGFAIDRFQRLRGLGNFADVQRFDANLQAQKEWPWQNNLAYAAHPPIYFNYEAARQATIDAEKDVTVVKVYEREMLGGGHQKDVQLPDARTMATFDTFEIDLTMNCPKADTAEEADNCGAWDYLAGLSFDVSGTLAPPDLGGTDGGMPQPLWREAARFITTYHRAGRFTVDASHFLPYLAAGGTQRMNLDVSGQTYETTLTFRLRSSGGALHPTRAEYLFGGGGFDPNYNPGHMTPVQVMIPAGAKKVELRALITGHGGATKYNCAEFCDHHHLFTVNGMTYTRDFPEAGSNGDSEGCLKKTAQGAVPNQSGTWWFGRGGWCPGMQVDPWVVDVTDHVKPGQVATVSYKGLFMNQPPALGLGNIVMSSWLVIWE